MDENRPRIKPRIYEWLALLRELQSAAGDESSALLPSVLDRAFKGELCPPSHPSPKSKVRI